MPHVSPERWRALSPYLDEALEIPTAGRAAWLAAIEERDGLLAADLRAMLHEHELLDETRFLEQAVLDPTALPSMAGQVVGAYRLVSLIARGGTGSVWLAERADGRFRGHAAVKLLNISLIGREGEERFRREGTILARLRHPNIAHLIDAGVTPAGQPYLVLEYVDGQSIEKYCDDRALGIPARLRLYLEVLEAVAHAHANLTVHRDIKPPNVLIGSDGHVKLLDFGIAKLLERDAWRRTAGGETSALSRELGATMTPAYAAPEQLSGAEVTTATDVYALGVLLYVLLTGSHPAGNDVPTPASLVRSIIVTEPSRASEVVGSQAEDRAKYRSTTPWRLQRTLRGDLDAIIAKALKKNPAERYPSVTALADDLRRFLRHEPIGARPATVRYRTAMFVRRHLAGVAASGVALILIAGLVGLHTLRLSAARDRAQREAAKALMMSNVLMGVLTSADPYAPRPGSGEPTVRALLDRASERVVKDLAADPGVQAEMLTAMGRTYRRLGAYDSAQQLLDLALADAEKAFGPADVHVADALDSLGVVLADKGDYTAAGRTLERALRVRRALVGNENAEVAVTLVELGRVYQDQGWNDRAEGLQAEALEIRRRVLGEEHRETAVSRNDLASVLRLNGHISAAETLLKQALETNRKTRGDDHPNTATTLHDLAVIEATRGNFHSAESMLLQALPKQRKALGDKHPVVAATLNSLSHVLLHQRRYDEAARAVQEALDIARGALGPDHQLVGIYTIDLGAIRLAQHESAAAEIALREGLRIRSLAPGIVPSRRRTFLEDDWSLPATKALLGASLSSLGRVGESEAVLLEARRDLDSLPAARSVEMKAAIVHLVDLYVPWGRRERESVSRALLGF
jgi:serine/threonine protein kinase/tetratricopeptide (TPR) repeat protein